MAKVVNYTAEQTAELVAAYEAAESSDSRANTVTAFAEKFGKSVASIRQKLVREGVYEKKAYTNKNGEKPESKEAIASRIADALGVNVEAAESLTKANKAILLKLADALCE